MSGRAPTRSRHLAGTRVCLHARGWELRACKGELCEHACARYVPARKRTCTDACKEEAGVRAGTARAKEPRVGDGVTRACATGSRAHAAGRRERERCTRRREAEARTRTAERSGTRTGSSPATRARRRACASVPISVWASCPPAGGAPAITTASVAPAPSDAAGGPGGWGPYPGPGGCLLATLSPSPPRPGVFRGLTGRPHAAGAWRGAKPVTPLRDRGEGCRRGGRGLREDVFAGGLRQGGFPQGTALPVRWDVSHGGIRSTGGVPVPVGVPTQTCRGRGRPPGSGGKGEGRRRGGTRLARRRQQGRLEQDRGLRGAGEGVGTVWG